MVSVKYESARLSRARADVGEIRVRPGPRDADSVGDIRNKAGLGVRSGRKRGRVEVSQQWGFVRQAWIWSIWLQKCRRYTRFQAAKVGEIRGKKPPYCLYHTYKTKSLGRAGGAITLWQAADFLDFRPVVNLYRLYDAK